MPSRMFAIGEEPVGIRVSPYHKPYCISKILSALDENEVKSVRVSPFGKLVEIVEKPPFSRCFRWFLMSRHLKISKKHEGNSNGIGDDTVPLPDEYTAEEAPVGAEDASGVGEDMIDVNMTAVNNLNEPSSTGVVNNPTSPLVDRDANTTVDRGLFFPHGDQFINQEVPVHAADDDPLVPPYRKKQASKGYSESASGRVPV
ncbi:PREDICTED: uncharacterized protein LOC106306195 isoform X3 [Brassica oleracea var. oleracea]|uniref:uncharacterized protein LOC106306195 isoform X3 n=1 Tax=Brassica oleracea var. oleracea TaxID=109376 RepID=UPI0006A75686|nr:PREDICTED: uncharacterized protein LOC106306195 isoform X3 [Brassica oleracea var. oleracea]